MTLWVPFLLFFFLFLLTRRTIRSVLQKKEKKKLPPGPSGLPIIGNLHQLGELPHQSLWKLSEKYGPVVYLQLGSVPMVVVSSSEAARQVLKVHDAECCSRPPLAGTGRLSYNYLDVAFSPYDNYWKELRKLVALELLSNKRVQSFQSIREEKLTWLIRSISESASSETQVNLSEKLLFLTASVTCEVGFGMSFRGSKIDTKRFQDLVNEAFKMLEAFSASDFLPHVGKVIDWLTGMHDRRERSFRDLDAFHEQAIDLHLQKSGEGHEDIINLLLKLEREQVELGTARLTRNHIKAILNDVLLGGTDTSAITMTWAMAELIRKPRAMRIVQAEIRDRIGEKGIVGIEDIEKLEYLKIVIKETLRLHPPIPLLLPREAMSEFQINGYTIYPKTRIQVNVWGMGRDPDVWEDPEEFIPERFMDSSFDVNEQNFKMLPFGGGRRVCPGMYMGTVMVELGLANLLYHFDWKLPEGMSERDIDMEEASGLSVYKKTPLELIPVRYRST